MGVVQCVDLQQMFKGIPAKRLHSLSIVFILSTGNECNESTSSFVRHQLAAKYIASWSVLGFQNRFVALAHCQRFRAIKRLAYARPFRRPAKQITRTYRTS